MHYVLSISFTEPGLFYILLLVFDWLEILCYLFKSMSPTPQILRLSREVSRG